MDELTEAFNKLNLVPSSTKKKDGTQSWLFLDEVGHEYKVSYEATSGIITWRCNNSQFPNCPGKAATNGYNKPVTFKVPHEFAPSIKTKVKELSANIKSMAANNPDTTKNYFRV
ncbi:unnamed protein product [Brachionus calyciflorus]|uniref:Uncharacterized protein n=1 Tax=Brachionus calyciflorus TaxID=104777 RepID=A0A814GPA1_9BILA|nr:unnamed protein product [Brachionus calyciflorus]